MTNIINDVIFNPYYYNYCKYINEHFEIFFQKPLT